MLSGLPVMNLPVICSLRKCRTKLFLLLVTEPLLQICAIVINDSDESFDSLLTATVFLFAW